MVANSDDEVVVDIDDDLVSEQKVGNSRGLNECRPERLPGDSGASYYPAQWMASEVVNDEPQMRNRMCIDLVVLSELATLQMTWSNLNANQATTRFKLQQNTKGFILTTFMDGTLSQ